MDVLESPSADIKQVFYAIKTSEVLNCKISVDITKGVVKKLLLHVKDAKYLLDFYYPIASLVSIKSQGWFADNNIILENPTELIQSIKALSQTDGTWRYESSDSESSAYAAGIALESIAGVIALGGSDIRHAAMETVKKGIVKLFDNLESYDDGSLYFEERSVDVIRGYGGAVLATSSVVRGVTVFAAVTSETFDFLQDKIVGIGKFFLGVGVPGNSIELFHQIDALGHLDNNKIVIPLVLSFPATVLSLTAHDQLKVAVRTLLGSIPPPVVLKVVHANQINSKDAPLISNQRLDFNQKGSIYTLNFPFQGVDVGRYSMTFEVLPESDALNERYSAGGQVQVVITVTGVVKSSDSELAIVDSDTGSAETVKRLDFSKDETVSLSANHLQKLRISFKLNSPIGRAFKPHQAFLILRHESKVEHVFLLKASGKKLESILDILGLVEKLYYLSGRYTMELAVGDATMENSFLKPLGSLELDLPEPPENAPRPRLPVDISSRFGPKPEITHIFRKPEKRPPAELSNAFLVLTLLPFLGLLVGLFTLGTNFKNFPSSGLPLVSAILFHIGIFAVLVLYAFFWVKLNLFTTLKYLGFLGIFLLVFGHSILSHLSNTSAKVKTT
eukprot:TRINITY_DN33139_c0_g1_i1.p1 TRINITY_DN33139_c0_g1~~TRINITY_DN33139_c0_g1_i1.p1  ORF type:complete len:699 (-),score=112.87 TRINITY_DN33139_c0_g1_i1:497-2347(-)